MHEDRQTNTHERSPAPRSSPATQSTDPPVHGSIRANSEQNMANKIGPALTIFELILWREGTIVCWPSSLIVKGRESDSSNRRKNMMPNTLYRVLVDCLHAIEHTIKLGYPVDSGLRGPKLPPIVGQQTHRQRRTGKYLVETSKKYSVDACSRNVGWLVIVSELVFGMFENSIIPEARASCNRTEYYLGGREQLLRCVSAWIELYLQMQLAEQYSR